MYFLLKDRYRENIQLWHTGMFGFVEHQITLTNGVISYNFRTRPEDRDMEIIGTAFTLNSILSKYAIERL